MRIHEKLYVGGEWIVPTGDRTFDVTNSSTEEVIARIPSASVADVDRAVAAAVAALPGWSARPVEERAQALEKLAEGLEKRQKELAETIAAEVGMPLRLSSMVQAGAPTKAVRTYAELARKHAFEETIGTSTIVHEPVGVVAAITPWNYPLNQVIAKVAPAIVAGCTVVLKPSEVAPLSAFILAEVAHEAGLPAGVFNLVTGEGPVIGEALAAHPQVDMVSFTGSTRAGKRVAELASKTVKRVALELGGKSANVLLDDADLERAVRAGINNCFLNSGQTCSAWTRMLVPRVHLAKVEEIAKAAAEKMTLGDALGGGKLGPLVSAAQRERVRGYIRKGLEEGARLVLGGPDAPEHLPKGYFVQPTIFSDVKPEMTIAQEEIFGPVLVIIPYDTEEEAIAIANGTIYGLAGAVWSANVDRARKVARRLRTGQVDVNGASYNPLAPFGGYKQSGLGRENGKFGLEEFLETKSIQG
ncbi:aldehyde dehydrogenase family protein [Myxococcota bacterium]|nr:aldehyde dehydrogenase family protein [Myxococcota bacterium]